MHINLEKIVRKNQNGIIKKYKHNKYLDEFRFWVHSPGNINQNNNY